MADITIATDEAKRYSVAKVIGKIAQHPPSRRVMEDQQEEGQARRAESGSR